MTTALDDHHRNCCSRREHRSEQIDLHLAPPLLWVGFQDRLPVAHPGVVHEDVEAAPSIHRVFHHAGHLTRISHVRLDHLGDSPTEVALQAGDSVYLPRGIPHAFKVGDTGATLLEINTPGGFEHFHLDAGDKATHDGPPEQGPPDIERMARCAADYGCTILGPPAG